MMQSTKAELTIKAILIGVFLALILCGTNIYLGLKIGSTISASIPASILAMGVLRMFKNYSVLENNIAQTIASAGEAIAAMVIFVFPALLILGTWKHFDYLSVCLLSICGGFVGIAFSVILRRVLLNDTSLTFPEGIAIGVVLKTTADNTKKSGIGALILGIIISGILGFCQAGLQIFASSYMKIVQIGKSIFGVGIGFSPALIGAGYLVGFNNTLVAVLAMLAGWLIFLPIFSLQYGISNTNDIAASGFLIWKEYVRPVGIGTLIFSGIATIISLIRPIFKGINDSINALKNIGQIKTDDRDLSIKKLMWIMLLSVLPIGLFIYHQLTSLTSFNYLINIIIAILILCLVLILGFIIAAVAGYFAGMVGSTNSPNSGLLFIAVIALSIIFGVLAEGRINTNLSTLFTTILFLVAFIGFGACITNDNIQDFKSGQIVGASPYKQQIALFFGVIASSLIAPLLIELVFEAYGIAGIVAHPGINAQNTLSAPQATAFATLTKNILFRAQNWNLILYGVGIGVIALIIDKIISKKYRVRCPILSVGLGIYLPPAIAGTLFLGGVVRLLVSRKHAILAKTHNQEQIAQLTHKTNLFICGLVAGESLMGLVLAVPFVIMQSSDALKIVGDNFLEASQFLSVIITLLLIGLIYKSAQK